MTVRMLQYWNGYSPDAIVTGLSNEAALIAAGYATTDLDGANDGRIDDAKLRTNADGSVALVGLDGVVIGAGDPSSTITGSYTGNGSSQSIDCGFAPDLVVIKADSTAIGVLGGHYGFYRRSAVLNGTESVSGITFTSTGFSVDSTAGINTNAATHHYFAYRDNGSGSVREINWAGNALSGRTVDLLLGSVVDAALIKRDNGRDPVVAVRGHLAATHNGVQGTYCSIGDDGILTLDNSNNTNEWSGALGEGTIGLAFCRSADVHVQLYTGNATARKLPLPWEPEFFMVVPRGNSGYAAHFWFSSLAAGQHMPAANGGVNTGRLTAVGNGYVTLSSHNGVNANGIEFVMIAFRKRRKTPLVFDGAVPVSTKSVQLAANGYITCGTSDTLKIDGAISIEWCGAIYPAGITPFAGGAGTDDEANKQFPLICRSDGADAVDGHCSFALEAINGIPGAVWNGSALAHSTYGTWQMAQDSSPDLDNYPCNTGLRIDDIGRFHVLVTHDGGGHWVTYLNGRAVKERKLDLVAAIGKPNNPGYSGHTLVIGARKRASTPEFAHGAQFVIARLYARALSPTEVRKNYLSMTGRAAKTSDFIEEWDAKNASGTSLPATVHAENNGVIVNGVVIGI